MLLTGHCHCGNVRFHFETRYTPADLPLRACQCSFCRSHGAVTTTDPRGQVSFMVSDREAVGHYRFGFGITDILICKRCGNYVAGIIETDGQRYATLNANLLECRPALTTVPVNYDDESATGRVVRRSASWTPMTTGPGFL
ncbi:MAG: aldehyde-activating protein [Gammaproteobacteria bacterium]